VRASLGLGSGVEDVEVLADALGSLVGPRAGRERRSRPAHLAAPIAGLLGAR